MPGDMEVFEVRGAARRLDQELHQHESEQHAEAAEDDERPAPTVVLADQAAEESAGDGSDVDARSDAFPWRASGSFGRDNR